MAEKISTLVLKVDLSCSKCYNKIRKILYKFRSSIKGQTIDEKNNTVTIFGPFDPNMMSKKLQCKAGDIIKCIEIKEPEKQKSKPTKPVDKKPPAEEKPTKTKSCCKPCCKPSCEGYYGRGPCCYGKAPPCYDDCGRPPCYDDCGKPPCYDDCGKLPCYDDCGKLPCYRGCGGTRPNICGRVYSCEENPTTCSIYLVLILILIFCLCLFRLGL